MRGSNLGSHCWFKPRGYKHFDAPVGEAFALKVSNPGFAARHSWAPLIHYLKRTKRYKPNQKKTVYKDRPIMYAAHRDACILSRYAYDLSAKLDAYYLAHGLTNTVIAYRSLGLSNYDFAARARDFAAASAPCVVLCFDISGFFDHLDHSILKARLKRILECQNLSPDWFAVFKFITRHKWVDRDDLRSHPVFGPRLSEQDRRPIATISEAVHAGIQIHKKKAGEDHFGIPQGTPISAVFANLYMLDFDIAISEECFISGAFYQRYSDDIIVICKENTAAHIEDAIKRSLAEHRLELSHDKTERVSVSEGSEEFFQYLGFYMNYGAAFLRGSSLSKQWRKLKRSIARTKMVGGNAVASGTANKIYTKKLRRKFSPTGITNFSSYARRAARSLSAPGITKQVRRLERAADCAIRDLNK